VGKRCRKPSRRGRRGARCIRLIRIRRIDGEGVAGMNRTPLRRLRPGRYRLTVAGRDAAGNSSTVRVLAFTVRAR
jgi:hypothetical protein